MRARWLVFVAGVFACSSAGSVLGDYVGPPDDAHILDGGMPDASSSDGDAGPCADCEYFPETCSSDILCPNGPFDSENLDENLDSRTWINSIRGRSPTDVWIAGSVGAVAHFDGTSWTLSDVGGRESMTGLWLTDSAEVTLGTFTRIYARSVEVADAGTGPSADGWMRYAPSYAPGAVLGPASDLVTAWAPPGGEWLWCAVGTGGRGSGGELWRLRRSPTTAFEAAVGIPSQVCSALGCARVASIHGSSPDELWAVGHMGETVRITNASGDTPTVKPFDSLTQNVLKGVWEASASEAWSVGARGTIRHYVGDSMLWEAVSDVPTDVDLNAVWGSSPADVWAVGDEGVVLHYDGSRWSRVKVAGLAGERPALTTVWVATPGHVWIGGKGVVLTLGGKP
jgi:hypothetical protein